MASTLYMIPCPIAELDYASTPQYVIDQIHAIDHFIVERSKTARKYLKEIKHPISQQDLIIEEMDKHDKDYALKVFYEWGKKSVAIGVISEAGCPGIADPGARIVHAAHKANIKVVPLIGPSSIFLALMASGMNGQSFSFHGYLPNKKEQLSKKIKEIERISSKNNTAEIFIETPYRNVPMFEDILRNCKSDTFLCIAGDITGSDEYIKKKRISEWKKEGFPLKNKIPAIFIIGR
ncbi:SAM-dependent methyltransferase [Saprospiraceae bacterium]|nr:SAM-dependent methyltransferase [Saprospiraceae bacterium]